MQLKGDLRWVLVFVELLKKREILARCFGKLGSGTVLRSNGQLGEKNGQLGEKIGQLGEKSHSPGFTIAANDSKQSSFIWCPPRPPMQQTASYVSTYKKNKKKTTLLENIWMQRNKLFC